MDEKQYQQDESPEDLARKMSRWHEANPKATLTEIEEAVEAELAKMRTELIEGMLEEANATQEEPDCPGCGEKMVRNGKRKRKLKSKEGEVIQLKRQQWRCLSCGATLFPPG